MAHSRSPSVQGECLLFTQGPVGRTHGVRLEGNYMYKAMNHNENHITLKFFTCSVVERRITLKTDGIRVAYDYMTWNQCGRDWHEQRGTLYYGYFFHIS